MIPLFQQTERFSLSLILNDVIAGYPRNSSRSHAEPRTHERPVFLCEDVEDRVDSFERSIDSDNFLLEKIRQQDSA